VEGDARFCSRRAEQLGGDWATTWASDGDGKREMEICGWVWVWRARFSPLGASLFMLSTARVADGRGPRERRGHARTAGYSSDRWGHGWVGPDARERGETGWWLDGWVGDSDQSRSGADRWGEGLAVHWSVELDGEDESCRVADMPAAGGQHELGLRYDWAANCRVGGAAQVSRR